VAELMARIDTPKLSFPFRLHANGASAVVVEQDSDDEILDCVEVLLSTEKGSREEAPAYGVEDQSFLEGGANQDQILTAISKWEPRAERTLEADQIISSIQRVRVKVIARDA
jgi:phage baseplate assembly protein W